jgi:Gram-negative bacterial TonB protein C-terminal
MRGLRLPAGAAFLLVSWLLWRDGVVLYSIVPPRMPAPEDGKVLNGIYVNDYFDLSFPLPEGWTEAEPGPAPSDCGYYVLGSSVPRLELSAAILIAAQDMFFATGTASARSRGGASNGSGSSESRSPSLAGTGEIAHGFRQAMSEIDGMTIDREPSEVKIAGRLLHRVDFSGVGLYRAMFTTAIRCHAVSFNLTARDPDRLANLALSMNKLSVAGKMKIEAPPCVENYATPENLLRRVEPVSAGPKFTPVPVRLIIDTQGSVKHVHVIHASPGQRKNIEEALRQWRFRPYRMNGHALEIETGLTLQFTRSEPDG